MIDIRTLHLENGLLKRRLAKFKRYNLSTKLSACSKGHKKAITNKSMREVRNLIIDVLEVKLFEISEERIEHEYLGMQEHSSE